MNGCPFSSVSEGLLRNIIVFLFSTVDELDGIRVLPSCERLLSLLVGYEWLSFINIVSFTFSESEMVSLIGLVPHGCQDIRDDQVEELRHVYDVQELGTVADVKPHPVSVGLQANGLKTEELQEVGSITSLMLILLTLCLTTNERQTGTCSRT
jgi:hypothetical protein